jgi:hypothetical protein
VISGSPARPLIIFAGPDKNNFSFKPAKSAPFAGLGLKPAKNRKIFHWDHSR